MSPARPSRFTSILAGCCLTLVLSTVFSSARGAEVPSSPQQGTGGLREGTIVAFGDSLTQGYGISEKEAFPAQLERRLRSAGFAYKVVNAGISGETSSGALSRVKWILRQKPDIVILETGANDGFRGLQPDLIEKNLEETVRLLKEQGVIVVLAGMQMLSNLGPEYTDAFKKIYPKVAQRQNVILIPFFLAGVAGEPALNLPDGIHPTTEGYRMVTDLAFPYVLEAIRKVEVKSGQ
jgi:acyl-CoA thioesterase-1